MNKEDICKTIASKTGLAFSSQFCRDRSVFLTPKQGGSFKFSPNTMSTSPLRYSQVDSHLQNGQSSRNPQGSLTKTCRRAHSERTLLCLQQLMACKYFQFQLKHYTPYRLEMYVLTLCIRGFKHLQETAVGYKLFTWYTMSHFMSEYDQNSKGKLKTTWRSVLEKLSIQGGLLLRDNSKDHDFI